MTEVKKKIGRCYMIYNVEDPSQFYIGSTWLRYLTARLATHRFKSTLETYSKCKLYRYVNSLPSGWSAMKIQLVEQTAEPVTRDELLQLEGRHQKAMCPTLNKNIAGNVSENGGVQGYQKKYQREYRTTHKDKLKTYFQAYYKSHQEILRKKQKEYYKSHADSVKQYQKEKRKRMKVKLVVDIKTP